MKIALIGYGAMGKEIEQNISKEDTIVGIVALNINTTFSCIKEKPDVVIDFSNAGSLESVLKYAEDNKVPLLIGTTGHSKEQVDKIKNLANKIPILMSGNYSLGVILLNRLVKQVTPILKDTFDIEIIEKHHNLKVDAPSGTCKMLIDSVNKDNDMKVVYGREGIKKREKKEIGVHSIRGGTIVGEHQVIYAGTDEVLEITHHAYSKAIFAKGALKGAKWLIKKDKGLYNMEDVLFN